MLRGTAALRIYGVLGVVSVLVAWYFGKNPLILGAAWVKLPVGTAHAFSGLLGLTLGLGIVALTGPVVEKTAFGRRLARELQPFSASLSAPAILLLAFFSALSEELLFRSVLQPLVGLVPQALIFGLFHQLPGRSRWIWVAWATMMGGLFGVLYQSTGSLLGPLVAHAVINAMNLRFLQTQGVHQRPERLGGILRSPHH